MTIDVKLAGQLQEWFNFSILSAITLRTPADAQTYAKERRELKTLLRSCIENRLSNQSRATEFARYAAHYELRQRHQPHIYNKLIEALEYLADPSLFGILNSDTADFFEIILKLLINADLSPQQLAPYRDQSHRRRVIHRAWRLFMRDCVSYNRPPTIHWLGSLNVTFLKVWSHIPNQAIFKDEAAQALLLSQFYRATTERFYTDRQIENILTDCVKSTTQQWLRITGDRLKAQPAKSKSIYPIPWLETLHDHVLRSDELSLAKYENLLSLVAEETTSTFQVLSPLLSDIDIQAALLSDKLDLSELLYDQTVKFYEVLLDFSKLIVSFVPQTIGPLQHDVQTNSDQFLLKFLSRNKLGLAEVACMKGANLNMQFTDPSTQTSSGILHKLLSFKPPLSAETLEFLIQKGLSINTLDSRNNSLLHCLFVPGFNRVRKPLMERLIQRGIDVNVTNADGNTALHVAMMSQMSSTLVNELARIIIEQPNFRVELCNHEGVSQTLCALKLGYPDLAITLIKRGAELDRADQDGLSVKKLSLQRYASHSPLLTVLFERARPKSPSPTHQSSLQPVLGKRHFEDGDHQTRQYKPRLESR